MKVNRWFLRAALVGAALVLAPGAAQAFAVPAAAHATAHDDDAYRYRGGWPDDDAYRYRGGWPDDDSAGASDDRAGPLLAEWGAEPDPGPGLETPAPLVGTLSDGLCEPGTPPTAPETSSFYLGNPLLGPAVLPTAPPVGPLLAGYQRFGGLTEQQFLQQYGNANQTAYVFPPADGFELAPNGVPIRARQELLPGYRIDRFGFPGGQFLAPLGTPFGARSLPPSNLNTPANAPLANYHVYCVLKPFDVDSGPIAPWFAQPGLGTQFKLNSAYLPQAGAALSITWLLQNGYLVEENLTPNSTACADAPARPEADATVVAC